MNFESALHRVEDIANFFYFRLVVIINHALKILRVFFNGRAKIFIDSIVFFKAVLCGIKLSAGRRFGKGAFIFDQ